MTLASSLSPKTWYENSRGTCLCCAAVLKTLDWSEGDVAWQRLSYMIVKELREYVEDGRGDIRKSLQTPTIDRSGLN